MISGFEDWFSNKYGAYIMKEEGAVLEGVVQKVKPKKDYRYIYIYILGGFIHAVTCGGRHRPRCSCVYQS